MNRPNRSIVSLLCMVAIIGSVLIITASGGLFFQKEGINAFSSPSELIALQINSVNSQIPITYQSNTPDQPSYTENSTACGYCGSNPYPVYPSVITNITPYYPPKFWNYPPPGYMPLVPHTDPAIYYSDATTTGLTNGFEKGLGYLFR